MMLNDGVPVLSKSISADVIFPEDGVDAIAKDLKDSEQMLNAMEWPDFKLAPQISFLYCRYYRAVLADTIQKFNYGKTPSNIPVTKKYSALAVSDLKAKHSVRDDKDPKGKIKFFAGDMLARARAYKGKNVCIIPNPANEDCIGGGAFLGAPNLEEDLFRISDLGISLVAHAREDGDFKYAGGPGDVRPFYNSKLKVNEALASTNIRIIKEIKFKEGNHWYGKEFKDLAPDQQLTVSVVSNAAVCLCQPGAFTAEERVETEIRIRAHITAMIESGTQIGFFTAFGCGAFNNPPQEIAEIYAKLLIGEGYVHFFEQVEFTIIDPVVSQLFEKTFRVYDKDAKLPADIKVLPQDSKVEKKPLFELRKTQDTVFFVFDAKNAADEFITLHSIKPIRDQNVTGGYLPSPDSTRIKEKWVVRVVNNFYINLQEANKELPDIKGIYPAPKFEPVKVPPPASILFSDDIETPAAASPGFW